VGRHNSSLDVSPFHSKRPSGFMPFGRIPARAACGFCVHAHPWPTRPMTSSNRRTGPRTAETSTNLSPSIRASPRLLPIPGSHRVSHDGVKRSGLGFDGRFPAEKHRRVRCRSNQCRAKARPSGQPFSRTIAEKLHGECEDARPGRAGQSQRRPQPGVDWGSAKPGLDSEPSGSRTWTK